MNSLKLFSISAVAFLLVMYALQPRLFRIGTQYDMSTTANQVNVSKTNLQIDYRNILDLDIPKRDDSNQEWRGFIGQVKLMAGLNVERPIFRYRSAAYPFLAYLAMHKPALFLAEIEAGNIDQSVFALMLQMGLLNDWEEHTKSPNMFIRSTPKALLALATSNSDRYAKQRAKLAFLDPNIAQDPFPASPRSLAYALGTMTTQEQRAVFKSKLNVDIKYSQTTLPALKNYMESTEYANFITRHAGTGEWDKGFLVDLAIKADADAKLQIVSDYRRSLREGRFDSPGYCVICALALSMEGGIGTALLDQQKEASHVLP